MPPNLPGLILYKNFFKKNMTNTEKDIDNNKNHNRIPRQFITNGIYIIFKNVFEDPNNIHNFIVAYTRLVVKTVSRINNQIVSKVLFVQADKNIKKQLKINRLF